MIATHSLAPECYFDEQLFLKEKTEVFEKNWIFVGFSEQLANNHDFITTQIGDKSVVVQNFGGSISALLNVCSHRKATLQTLSNGNRPLVCPYHCWSYKKDGQLSGVPLNRTDFGLDDAGKKALSLRQFALETCGRMLFVRVAKDGPTLSEFLGPYFDILEQISTSFIEPVQQDTFEWNTNWKIACETVLEVYHVTGVHPETFAKFAKAECEINFFDGHSTGNTPLHDEPKKWWNGARKHLKFEKHAYFKEYNHYFIYPNLAIGLTDGSLMSLQTYQPVTAISSKLHFQLRMMSSAENARVSDAVRAAIKANFTEFNKIILNEDKLVAESCQVNMSSNNIPGLLGKCEDRIRHFHSAWREDMQYQQES
ncbi:Rieske (2Fe-2S) region [Shewanella denitrificans OS217]|uniref:Rieske (2Fe-2S) region n=1 Tax=Shewanella denitrificans (strain OS217 / ATCC BAA-1090 / DSM 15013) TaxID=318161 RepID=Q12JI5_SHEDO|nr:aromatic ring-hydroxylating dioxygenase subunit alpha [Shewanella denitrificans]ABE56391.1 Rieske (2Fe-2S) region [Shewanella denitrificans OS217]